MGCHIILDMTALIIGSTAMYHWFPQARKPKDLDLLTPAKIVSSHSGVVDASWHEAAEAVIEASTDKVFATPDVLLTLKVAHAHWNINHDKTLFDIKFLKDRGAVVIEDLYAKLIPVFTKIHGNDKVPVNKPMKEFFTDAVPRAFDHEWLHEQVAFYERPLHERIRESMDNVRCSRKLFEQLSFEDRCLCALEEILVTAIERFLLTANSKPSQLSTAVSISHRKLCTTMASGWFARFNIEFHYDLLIDRRTLWKTQLTKVLSNLPPTIPAAFYKPSLKS